MCARRKGWGDGALVAAIVGCVILTAAVVLLASAGRIMALSEPVGAEAPMSVPMSIIAYSLTVLPGLAAIDTLAVCRVLRRSDVLPWGAAWRAGLVPAVWFGLGLVVFLAGTVAYCS